MLKEKRVEFHSGVCYACAGIFIVVTLLCMLGKYASLDTVSAATDVHTTMYFTGYNLLEYVSEPANLLTYKIDYTTVVGTCNFLILICMGIIAFSILVGILSSQKETFKKSLIAIQVFYIVALVLSIFGPLQFISKIIDNYGDNVDTISYSFGFLPWVSAAVCLITFVIFSLFFKDGYGRRPDQKQRFKPGMFSNMFKKKVEVTETAVAIDAPVVTDAVVEEVDAPVVEQVVEEPVVEQIVEESVEEVKTEEVKTEEV